MIIEAKSVILNDGRQLTIRTATEDDSQRLLKCMRTVVESCYFLMSAIEELDLSDEQERSFVRGMVEHDRQTLIVAEAEGEIVGISGLETVGHYKKVRHRAKLGIDIVPKYQGLGLGYIMISELLDTAKLLGYKQVELGVYEDNYRAVHLYEKLGFKKYGLIPRAFIHSDGKYFDEIQMIYKC